MQSNSHPDRLITAFAEFGAKNPIPDIKPIGAPVNFASYREGFPPITRIPKSASGIPPEGLDINGVLYDLSNAVRWMQAGAKYPFDATFAAAIGGYPKGAAVIGNDGVTVYRSLVDNNSSDPNASPDGWLTTSGHVGMVVPFAMPVAPIGYLPADGSAVSRATYSDLFSKIGVIYGAGDGSTTFNLPDLRGEFIRGWNNGRSVDVVRPFGGWQSDEIRSHYHELGSKTITAGTVGPVDTAGSGTGWGLTGSYGGVETRPRNIALLYCIKY